LTNHTTDFKNWTGSNAFFRKLVVTVVMVAAVLLLWRTLHIFLLIFVGVILAVFLRKTGEKVSSMIRVPDRVGILLVILLLVLLGLIGLRFMAPQILYQVGELIRLIPSSWEQIKEGLAGTPFGQWIIQDLPSFQGLTGVLGGLMHQATAWLYTAFGLAVSGVIIAVLGIYFAFDAETYVRGMAALAPKEKMDRVLNTVHSLGATLYWWLIGRLISMIIIWVLTVLGLWFLGVPLILTLGTFAALMTFIPNLGPVISVIPAALLALQLGWAQAGFVIGLYAGIQAVESNVITPFVQRRMVSLPPGLILSAQLVMGVLHGALGILIATPLTAAIMVVISKLYIQDVQGKGVSGSQKREFRRQEPGDRSEGKDQE